MKIKRTKKARGARIGFVLAAVVLTGCSATPVSLSSPEMVAPTSRPALTDAQYVELVRENIPYFAKRTDAQLVDLAVSMCGTLQGVVVTGDPTQPGTYGQWKWLVQEQVKNGVPAEQAGKMVVYAAGRACPDLIDTYLPPA